MRYAIGVDIGGTKTACGLVDAKGVLKKKVIYKTGKTKKEALRRIIESISLLLEGIKKEVIGIGVGIPGVKDKKGRIYRLPNTKMLNGLDLVRILKKKFNKKVAMENDASCAALGEYKFGVCKKVKSLFVVTLGTGIGGGFVLNGKIYTGRGNAPEPGHMLIGEREWEEVASGKALASLLKKNKKRAYSKYASDLGIGLSNIIKLYDPEAVVLTGGAVNSQKLFLRKAIAVAKKKTFFPIGEIRTSNFPEEVGVIGASSLIL